MNCEAEDAATPIMRLAVDTIASSDPITARAATRPAAAVRFPPVTTSHRQQIQNHSALPHFQLRISRQVLAVLVDEIKLLDTRVRHHVLQIGSREAHKAHRGRTTVRSWITDPLPERVGTFVPRRSHT